ncbi:MAG: hypothetical protein D6732_13675 [Methanobacteriota archaeon]|nr:MAG: hypothetical protein D6732_13675 [Euryarchaeota archaeon]
MMGLFRKKSGSSDDYSMKVGYVHNGMDRSVFIRLFLTDFSNLSLPSRRTSCRINPDGSIVPTGLAKSLNELIASLLEIKERFDSPRVRFTIHLLVLGGHVEYRQLVIAVCVTSLEEFPLSEIATDLRVYCPFMVRPRRLKKMVRRISDFDCRGFPIFSIDPLKTLEFLPKQCIVQVSLFDLMVISEHLPSGRPSVPSDIGDGFPLGYDPQGNLLVIPRAERILLRGGTDALHFPLMESGYLPSNHVFVTKDVQFFQTYDGVRTVSVEEFGIDLLGIMRRDPSFGIKVFMAWTRMMGAPLRILQTAMTLVEYLNSPGLEHIGTFRQLVGSPLLSEVNVSEHQLSHFLNEFEEILTLPFFSNPDIPFRKGGWIALDCASIANPLHVLAIGLVLHELRMFGYHTYSLSIPFLDAMEELAQIWFRDNLPAEFNHGLTIFSVSSDSFGFHEGCDIVIEPYSSYKKFATGIPFPSVDDSATIVSVSPSGSFIFETPIWKDKVPENDDFIWNVPLEMRKKGHLQKPDESLKAVQGSTFEPLSIKGTEEFDEAFSDMPVSSDAEGISEG